MKTTLLLAALVLVCFMAPATASFLPQDSMAECSLEGKWESTKDHPQFRINITYVFLNDSTYKANVYMDLSQPEPCACRVLEEGVYQATPKGMTPDNLHLNIKTCQSTHCCGCEDGPVDYHILFYKHCSVLFIDLGDDFGIVDFSRVRD